MPSRPEQSLTTRPEAERITGNLTGDRLPAPGDAAPEARRRPQDAPPAADDRDAGPEARRPSDAALDDALAALPPGTSEAEAYRRHGEGRTRDEFRPFWLRALKVSVRPQPAPQPE